MRLFSLVPGLLAASLAGAADAPSAAEERTRMLAAFAAEDAALTRQLAATPEDVTLHSRRGDRRLFLGRFAAAVADFEKMIALDPALDAPHWRLGIAYYFAGRFPEASRQFEKYHAYDGGDRENGLWKFLADCRTRGRAAAQQAMLVYTRFDREPFPDLYALFQGRMNHGEFMAGLQIRGLDGNPRVMFFAQYYAGLHEDLLGRRASAQALLEAAVASPWGRTAEGGPAYMWQVARLHAETIAARPEAP